MEPAFGERGFYPDSYELYVILQNITKLVSQQQAYYDGKKLPFSHEFNPVVEKIMESQEKLGAAQLDGRSFVPKSNFAIHNYCCLLSLMITTTAFILPRTIPSRVLKVNEESKQWEWIFGSDSLNMEKARSDFNPKIRDALCMAIKNQSQVNLTKKGMKDTPANICHIGFKVDYYYNLELIYGGVDFDDSTGQKDSMGSFDFSSSEFNLTPQTIFTRIKGIADRIMKGYTVL